MRKTRFLLAIAGLLMGITPMTGGALGQPAITGNLALTQPPDGTQSWEEYIQEVLERVRVKVRNPGPGSPIKDVASMLQLQLTLFGLPDGLTAEDLRALEADAVALRDCASGETKPPVGTDFLLVVMLHDLGLDLLKRIDAY